MKLKNEKQLKQLIVTIGKNQVKIRDQIQEAMIHAIGHAIVHRDTVYGLRLMEACNGAIRRQGIVNYLGAFGPFTWNAKDEKFTFTKGWEACKPEDVETFLDKLESGVKWWEFTTEAKVQPYDPLKDFESLLRRVTKHIETATKEKRSVPHSDVFDYIQRAMDEYKLDHSKTKEEQDEKEKAMNPQDPVKEQKPAQEQQPAQEVMSEQQRELRQVA